MLGKNNNGSAKTEQVSATIAPTTTSVAQATSSTSDEMAVKTAAPAVKTSPTPKPVEITDQGSSKLYKDNKYGFSFSFSNTLFFNNSSTQSFAQFLEKQDGSNATRLTMQIIDNPSNASLEQVVKVQGIQKDDPYGLDHHATTISGHEVLKLEKTMTYNEICNNGDGSGKNMILHLLIKGNGYVVYFIPNNSCESFKRNWFDITAQTCRR